MESGKGSIRRERAALRQRYGDLFDAVAAILFEADPIGINFETNTDEYDSEVGTILPRLSEASAVEDVVRIVHEEFVRWFDLDEVGDPETHLPVATKIWEAWLVFKERAS